MKVVVIGSSGKIGRAAMAALKAAGHRAIGIDIRPCPGQKTILADCGDFGATMGALSGIDMGYSGVPDAVVHLAAYPSPGLTTDHRTFELNFGSTYNVFSAAVRLGIKRVVWASSETVMGIPFFARNPPAYAPLDEAHMPQPAMSYALSKRLGENLADAVIGWQQGMTIASLRFSHVHTLEDYAGLPDRQAQPEALRFNLWSYVDAEDCGEACRLACEADLAGHHVMNVAAADNIAGRPSADLMRDYLPDVPVKAMPEGERSLTSSQRAHDLICYTPRFSWRDRL